MLVSKSFPFRWLCIAFFVASNCRSFQLQSVIKIPRLGFRSSVSKGQVASLNQEFGYYGSGYKLKTALSVSSPKSSSSSSSVRKLDVDALTKYATALAVQVTLFYGVFQLLDAIVERTGFTVPFWVNVALFYAMSLRSRLFNPLSNKRPDPKTFETAEQGQNRRNMPAWTPPGVIFPIMWVLIIGPLRAFSTALVYDLTQTYASPAILTLALHLSIGDVWNTINNVEQRFGMAVSVVALVWISKAVTAYQYAQVSLLAGQLMGIPLLWLTVAGALVTRIWQLNPKGAELDPLYPILGDKTTEFVWFKKPRAASD